MWITTSTVRLYQQGKKWYAQEVLHLILTHLLSLITGTKSYHNRKMREWGIDIGFTYMPKFTYWESLTPEPLLRT